MEKVWILILIVLVLVKERKAFLNDTLLVEIFKQQGFTVTYNVSLSMDLPFWGGNAVQIDTVCRNTSRNVTMAVDMIHLRGVLDAVKFLCTKENRQEYVGYLKCYNNSEVRDIFKTCKDWKIEALKKLNNTEISNINKSQCSMEGIYQTCSKTTLEDLKSCGKNASAWFDMWWRKMNYYYHDSVSCIDSPGSSKDQGSDEWSIVLGIVLAVTACLLVIGIVVFVIFLFSRRKLGTSDDAHSDVRGPRGFGQRREVPPPYALVVNTPGESSSDGDSAPTTMMRLVDRENRRVVENEARLYDGNASNTTGNGLILPPPYQNTGPPPDIFGNEEGVSTVEDSDKEDELLSVATSTTQCSSINLQTPDTVPDFSGSEVPNERIPVRHETTRDQPINSSMSFPMREQPAGSPVSTTASPNHQKNGKDKRQGQEGSPDVVRCTQQSPSTPSIPVSSLSQDRTLTSLA